MKKNYKKIIWILGIVDAVAFILVIALLLAKRGKAGNADTVSPVSHSQTLSISIDKEKEKTSNSLKEDEKISDPDEDEGEEVIKGDTSIYDIPFGDGYEFPDLSEYEFVFIGDSIFDMFNSETSMPRQLEVYTGANVYNLSKSMSCAGEASNNKISMSGLTSAFLSLSDISNGQQCSFNTDIKRFAEKKHKDKKMIFVLNHCLNDYSFGTPLYNLADEMDIDCYEGALRSNISRIKAAYPKATLIFMEPYYVAVSHCGTDFNSIDYVLDDYIGSVEKIAGEYGLLLFRLRSYDFFKEYREGYLLDDGIHPNDMCSKTIARLFCDFVENNVK